MRSTKKVFWIIICIIGLCVLEMGIFFKANKNKYYITSVLGKGYLKIETPKSDEEDYKLELYINDNVGLEIGKQPDYIFPRYKESNGIFRKLEDVVIYDFTGDGWQDICIMTVYEQNGVEFYDPRIYVARKGDADIYSITKGLGTGSERYFETFKYEEIQCGYDIDYVMKKKLLEKYPLTKEYSLEVLCHELEKLYEKEKELGWEIAYKRLLCNIEEYLPLYEEFTGLLYMGIHDFEEDGIPELILSNSGLATFVFQYDSSGVECISNLRVGENQAYELLLVDNILISADYGSDGSTFTCFTYKNGEYIEGFYEEFHPNKAEINGEVVTCEQLEQILELEFGEGYFYWSEGDRNVSHKEPIDINNNGMDFGEIILKDFYW